MLNRRRFLLAAGVPLLGAGPALASADVSVVKLMSFSCSVCYAAESQDTVIARALQPLRGRFVWAPIPTSADESGDKERVYYASREVSERFSERVKQSLYKAIQERGLQLPDLARTASWLMQDLSDELPVVTRLLQGMQPNTGRDALVRAFNLVDMAGAQRVPTYVVIRNGAIDSTFDPNNVPGGTLTLLRDAVINRIQTLDKP